MRIPGLSRDSRLCACRTVHLDHPDENRKDGSITHNLYGCRDEIRPEDVEAPARMFFIARDGDNEPALWADEGNDRPPCLVRRCDVHPDIWLLLTSHPDTQLAGFECGNCERFVVDNNPADHDHLAEISRHRLGECA